MANESRPAEPANGPDALSWLRKPALTAETAAGRGAILLDRDLETVAWTNPAGARLLGLDMPGAAHDEIPDAGRTLLRQARTAARRALEDGEPVDAVVRTRTDFRTRLLKMVAKPHDDGVLLGVEMEGDVDTDAELTAMAFAAADEGEAAALLDGDGRRLSASDDLDALGLSADAFDGEPEYVHGAAGRHRVRFAGLSAERRLALVSREVEIEPRRWFYRAGESATADEEPDAPSPASDIDDAALLATDPEAADEVPVREAAAAELEPDEPEAVDEPTDETNEEPRSVGFLSRAASGVAATALGAAGLVRTVRQSDETDTEPNEVDLADGIVSDDESRDDLLALDGADEDDLAEDEDRADDTFVGAALYAAPEGYEPSAPAQSEEPEEESGFTFQRSERATRFAWSVDADQRFTSIEDKLARTVGPENGIREGETWRDAAARLGFDEGGAIADLLERGDTWSGRTVMWPVQGEALRVPVDLAGLPAFDRDRNFTGFNGFGIVRTADAAPSGRQAEPGPESGPQSGPEPEATPSEEPVQNIVEMPARSLSEDEQTAFEHIGERLGAESDGPLGKVEDGTPPLEFEAPEPAELIEEITEEEAADDAEVEEVESEEGGRRIRVAEVRDVDTSILARLPIPVLAYRADTLLFANTEFFRLTGYPSLEELADAGGVDALFGEHRDESDLEGAKISHRDGHRLDVDAHLQTVPWDHERAMLLTLKRDDDGPDDEPHDPRDPDDGKGRKPVAKSKSGRVRQVFGSVRKGSGSTATGTDHPFADLPPVALYDILDTATEGVVILDPEGEVRALNRPAEALFGIDAADIVGEPFLRLLAPESHRLALDYLAGLTGPGVASVLNDGREVIGRVGADLVGDTDGEDQGLLPLTMTLGRIHASDDDLFCAVLRDVSERRRTEEDLVAARAEAERASREKSAFLATVSHEVRTPLNAIIGFSEMMTEERFGPIGSERYRGYARDITTSGRHVLDIVNDLLDISKIEAGEMQLDFASVALNTIVTETVAMSQPQANRERIVIRTSLAADLPAVVADDRAMRQVVLNLLSNALRYTRAGGQVIVSTAYGADGREAGDVVLRVRDTGVGMDAEELEMALKPFRQVGRGESGHGPGERGGTGLGLPLTKAMVEANRAHFAISSRPQEGTLVEMRFPPQRVLTH